MQKGGGKMIKLRVFNLEDFLAAADLCRGPVNLLEPSGERIDIRGSETARQMLKSRYEKQKGILVLRLHIAEVKDYFKLVFFSITDC